jgi:hypothetical protein
MKTDRRLPAAPGIALLLAVCLTLAGCGSLPGDSYAALEDGAQRALSVTFSFSADVANWLAEPPPPQQTSSCAVRGLAS